MKQKQTLAQFAETVKEHEISIEEMHELEGAGWGWVVDVVKGVKKVGAAPFRAVRAGWNLMPKPYQNTLFYGTTGLAGWVAREIISEWRED